MSWQIALGILLIVQTSSILLTKRATDRISKKSVGVFYQYLFCAFLATLYAAISGKIQINSLIIGVGTVGLINGIGSYFQWKTSELSLSKTALILPLMEVITVVLAVVFLKEGTLWNIQLICGVLICLLAMLYFRFPKEKENQLEKAINNKWFLYAIAMILIFGVAGFFLKFFSDKVSIETFLMGFYVGAFLGSIPLLLAEKQNPIRVSRKIILLVLPVSLTITGSVFALFLAYQLGGPVSLVIPIRGLTITIIPILVGWLFLNERKGLSIHDWLTFGTAILGVILILTR